MSAIPETYDLDKQYGNINSRRENIVVGINRVCFILKNYGSSF